MNLPAEKIMSDLKKSINDLRAITIGLFKLPFALAPFEFVVDDSDGNLTCISFGSLGGISTLNCVNTAGYYERFPDNKNMLEFMEDVNAFHEFCQHF